MLCKVQYSTKPAHLQELFCTSGYAFSISVSIEPSGSHNPRYPPAQFEGSQAPDLSDPLFAWDGRWPSKPPIKAPTAYVLSISGWPSGDFYHQVCWRGRRRRNKLSRLHVIIKQRIP